MHKNMHIIQIGGSFMRTTLDLPKDLIEEAMVVTKAKTKTEAIKIALKTIIKQDKLSKIINFHGKVDLDIDLDILRKR